jgi:uncharacterized membrane protein YdbT with pleckstrin-like domain
MSTQTQTQEQVLTYRCPHCGTAVEVHSPADGALLTCPAGKCGKSFRIAVPVPAPVAVPANPPTEAVVSAQPTALSAAQAPASSPEFPVQAVRLSMIRRYPFRCLGYGLLIVAGLLDLIVCLTWDWYWLGVVGGVVAAYAAFRFLLWWVRMSQTRLTLTNKHGILTTGVFSRDATEFSLDEVVDYHLHQNTLMRWLDVGDLAIISASPSQKVVVMAVPHPSRIVAQLQMHMEGRKAPMPAPEGAQA